MEISFVLNAVIVVLR